MTAVRMLAETWIFCTQCVVLPKIIFDSRLPCRDRTPFAPSLTGARFKSFLAKIAEPAVLVFPLPDLDGHQRCNFRVVHIKL
jgi:hypothetical protein